MLKVQLEKWQQTAESFREEACKADHPRTRERLLALYELTQGQSATQMARRRDRNPQTVMEWVHQYTDNGPEVLTYQRSGGHPQGVKRRGVRMERAPLRNREMKTLRDYTIVL